MIIKCNGLGKSYGSKKALIDFSTEIDKGNVVGLLGPNGSGKTTLIKTLNGLLKPDDGTVLIGGMTIGVNTKKVVSYLPEHSYLNHNDRIINIVNYFQDFYEDFNKARAIKLIESLDINVNNKVKELSKGMQEKVQLALVMSRDAKVFILDEPIAGVDPASREYILETILKNKPENATLIIATHLIRDIEAILDKVIILKNGIKVYDGSIDGILKDKESLDQWFREEFRYVKTS